MQNQNRKSLILSLAFQMAVTALYGAGLGKIIFDKIYMRDMWSMLKALENYLPFFLILILSMIPQLALLIKHKLHSQDGEILPILFLVVSTQASLIVVDAIDAWGYLFYLNEYLLYIQRFAFLGSASLFLLSSLRYYGFASSSMEKITGVFLAFPLLLAVFAPVSSIRGSMAINTSRYEVFLAIGEICLYGAAIITFILVAFKDGTSMNIKRAVAFVLIIIGLFLTRFNDNLVTAILSVVMYIPGTIILVHSAGDSI